MLKRKRIKGAEVRAPQGKTISRFSGVLALVFLVITPAYSNESDAQAFVDKVAKEIVAILKDNNKSLNARKQQFRGVLKSYFDLAAIRRFAAGRYFRQMSQEQQQHYARYFEDALVENYGNQFDAYEGQGFSSSSVRTMSDQGILVTGKINRRGGAEPITAQWKVFRTANGFKVVDIFLDRVSMAQSLRNDYNNVIASRGISGFLEYVKARNCAVVDVDASGKGC